jgi:two-component system NtrC family sensor kinase
MGSIFMVEDKPDVLVMKAQNKLPEPVRQICTRVPFGKCVCGLTAATKEIQFTDHANPEHSVNYEDINPHGHYCIPILYANRVLGVINMYVKEGYERKSRDEEFLSAVANALAGIIERKRNENELRQSEEKLRVMFESLSEGIMVYDRQGNILRVNDAILDMHGYEKKEELIGKSLFDLIPEREHNQAMNNLKTTINAGHSDNIQYTFIRKDGSEFPGELSSTALLDDSGELTGFVAISIDITDRIRSNEQLIVTDRLAAIGELSSGIAHEINNPLTGIIGFSDLLMEREIPEDIRADLEIINKEARRTADIVKKLLTFARRHPEKKDSIDLNRIISEVIEMRNYEQKVNNIEVESNFAESLPEVIADGFELQQVFINLVVNAEYFMTEKNGRGTLTITT